MKKIILLIMLVLIQVVSAQFEEGNNLTQAQLNNLDFSNLRIFQCSINYDDTYVSWDWLLGSVLYVPHTCLSIKDITLNESRREKVRYTVYRTGWESHYTKEDFSDCRKTKSITGCKSEINNETTEQFNKNVASNRRFVESKQVKERNDVFKNLRCIDIFGRLCDSNSPLGLMGTSNVSSQFYRCDSTGFEYECPDGLSSGIGTRCYQSKKPNERSWYSCPEGWKPIK